MKRWSVQASLVTKTESRLTPEKPMVTSGIRLGTPAGTSRGFGPEEFKLIGNLISDVLDGLVANPDDNSKVEAEVRAQVEELCKKFPLYR